MTEIDDRELSRRLRALRVDPPASGFEARLAERLLATTPEAAPAPRREGRVIVGPWLRRGPVRMIGATALLLAGAAAAVEGGVVEWVQARVEAVRRPEPSPPPAVVERAPAPRRERPAPTPPADLVVPLVEPELRVAPERAIAHGAPVAPGRTPSVPRLSPERRLERPRDAAPLPERRPDLDPPLVPRLEIDPRGRERGADPDTRLGRRLARPGGVGVTREGGRDLERIRDIAKVRRERAAAGSERPRVRELREVRERRERSAAERRELMRERLRGGRQGP